MQNLQSNQPVDRAALEAEIARLKAALKQAPRQLTLKVSEKGAVSVYGLNRFPVTLYAAQWEKILGMRDQITEFIAANAETLKRD